MIDTGALNVGGRRTAGSGGGGGGGGVSATWVDENYISKAFFNHLFTIHSDTVTTEDPQGTVIEPNDTESVVDNIEAMFGFWTQQYVSAIGQNGDSGSGSVTALTDLVDVNPSMVPTAGQVLTYRNGKWTAETPQGGGGGTGTVTSITAGTGLTTGGTPITSSGTISINNTYATYISHGNTAYSWGDHALAGYASGSDVQTLQGFFDNSGNANSALRLTTVSKNAWGQTYWTAGGVPTSISGDMTSVGSITMNGNIYMDNTKRLYIKTSGGTLMSCVTVDSSNNLVVGESFISGGQNSYLRGYNVNIQTGSSYNNAISINNNGLVEIVQNTQGLKIGNAYLVWDSQHQALKVTGAGNTAMHLFATGGVSALGYSS